MRRLTRPRSAGAAYRRPAYGCRGLGPRSASCRYAAVRRRKGAGARSGVPSRGVLDDGTLTNSRPQNDADESVHFAGASGLRRLPGPRDLFLSGDQHCARGAALNMSQTAELVREPESWLTSQVRVFRCQGPRKTRTHGSVRRGPDTRRLAPTLVRLETLMAEDRRHALTAGGLAPVSLPPAVGGLHRALQPGRPRTCGSSPTPDGYRVGASPPAARWTVTPAREQAHLLHWHGGSPIGNSRVGSPMSPTASGAGSSRRARTRSHVAAEQLTRDGRRPHDRR